MLSIWEQWSNVHELLKNRTYLGEKLFFNFLGADFLAPKSGHRREKRPVLGPEGIRVGMRGMRVAILGMQEMRGIRVRMRWMEVGMRGFRVGIGETGWEYGESGWFFARIFVFIALAKILECEGHFTIQLLWTAARLLVTLILPFLPSGWVLLQGNEHVFMFFWSQCWDFKHNYANSDTILSEL